MHSIQNSNQVIKNVGLETAEMAELLWLVACGMQNFQGIQTFQVKNF